jgi:hypothetical protein
LTAEPVGNRIAQESPFATDVTARKLLLLDYTMSGWGRDLEVLGQLFQCQDVEWIQAKNIVGCQFPVGSVRSGLGFCGIIVCGKILVAMVMQGRRLQCGVCVALFFFGGLVVLICHGKSLL